MNLPTALQTGAWQPVNQGLSGAALLRGTFAGRDCYLKATPHNSPFPVRAEYDRNQWLKAYVPVAAVLAYLEDATHQYMVTAAVNGIELLAYEAEPVVLIRNFAQAIRQLHDLPIADCPFEWTVDDQIAFARATIERQAVRFDLMDAEFRDRDPADMLAEMIALRPAAPDRVVVHGDPYNENILVDSTTGAVAAYIDVGHAGIADRYTDLAMIYDDITDSFGESGWQQFLRAYGLPAADEQRLRFYRLFNEFM